MLLPYICDSATVPIVEQGGQEITLLQYAVAYMHRLRSASMLTTLSIRFSNQCHRANRIEFKVRTIRVNFGKKDDESLCISPAIKEVLGAHWWTPPDPILLWYW